MDKREATLSNRFLRTLADEQKTYINQLWVGTGYHLNDLPSVMADKDAC